MIALEIGGSGGWRPRGNAVHGAGRRGWAGTLLMLAGTLAVALASYSISMTVSAERAATDRLRQQNAELERALKSLEAERRVRMRLPQLERWNRDVLGLRPIDARQFLDSPLLLAHYGAPTSPAAAPTLAVMRDVPSDPQAHASSSNRRLSLAGQVDRQQGAADPALLAAVAAIADEPAAGGTEGPRPQLTAVALALAPVTAESDADANGGVGRR